MSIQAMLLLQAMVFSILVLSALIYLIVQITRRNNATDKRIPLVLPNKANDNRASHRQ